nr:MAG TPA: Diphosphoinositol pentakisphosphate kinase 2 N-terminal domain [Caudoviricetes sp.]
MQGYPLTKARVFVQLSRCYVVGDYGHRVSGFCPCRFRQSHNTTVEF